MEETICCVNGIRKLVSSTSHLIWGEAKRFKMLMRIRVLVLLIILYFIYMIIGAAVFMAMERPVEQQRCKDAKQFKAKWLNQTRRNEGFTEETLNKFIKNVTTFSGFGISLQGDVKCPANWDFQSSLFFTGTIITTIGYGNLAPTLWYSQIFCIFYALFGIPLFAIMFTGIGEYMAVLAEEVLKKFKAKNENDVRIVNAFFVFVLIVGGSFIFFQLIPAIIFTFVEGWTYRESVYYCFITLTTVGFGDFVAGTNPEVQYIALYRIMVLFWILFGLAYTFTAIDLIIHSLKAAVAKSKFVDFILYNWAEAEVSLHSEVESLLGDSSSGAEDLADDVFSSPEFAMFRRPWPTDGDNDGSDDGGPGGTSGVAESRREDTDSDDHLFDPPAEDSVINPASIVNTGANSRTSNETAIRTFVGGSGNFSRPATGGHPHPSTPDSVEPVGTSTPNVATTDANALAGLSSTSIRSPSADSNISSGVNNTSSLARVSSPSMPNPNSDSNSSTVATNTNSLARVSSTGIPNPSADSNTFSRSASVTELVSGASVTNVISPEAPHTSSAIPTPSVTDSRFTDGGNPTTVGNVADANSINPSTRTNTSGANAIRDETNSSPNAAVDPSQPVVSSTRINVATNSSDSHPSTPEPRNTGMSLRGFSHAISSMLGRRDAGTSDVLNSVHTPETAPTRNEGATNLDSGVSDVEGEATRE